MLRIYSPSDSTKPPSFVVVERIPALRAFGLPKPKKHLIAVDARAPAVSFVIAEDMHVLNREFDPESIEKGGISLTFRNDSGLWTAEIGRLASGIRIPWLVSVSDGAHPDLTESCSQHSVCVAIQCESTVQVRYAVLDEWQKTWQDYELTRTEAP